MSKDTCVRCDGTGKNSGGRRCGRCGGDGREVPPVEGSQRSPAVVYIAKCAEHGLHGERDECFVCSKPVEHVTYVRADMHLQVSGANGRKAQEIKRLNRDVEALKARLRQEVDAHRMTLHPHALPFTDEEWQGYLGTIPGLEEGTG